MPHLPPLFECTSRDGAFDAVCVRVAGELDLFTTPQLRQTLRDARLGRRLVVLDLREVAFMDSSGVHVIVDASMRARRGGRRLVVLRGPPDVDRVFTLTATADQVEFRDVGPPVQAPLRVIPEDVAS